MWICKDPKCQGHRNYFKIHFLNLFLNIAYLSKPRVDFIVSSCYIKQSNLIQRDLLFKVLMSPKKEERIKVAESVLTLKLIILISLCWK